MIRLRAYREAARTARIAVALWIAWAIIVWNVVFDHVIVVAGRAYISAAVTAANGAGPYARMDDWMRPAVGRGLWIATASAGLMLIVLVVALRFARRPTRAAQPL
jgi:hypothetical protein